MAPINIYTNVDGGCNWEGTIVDVPILTLISQLVRFVVKCDDVIIKNSLRQS